MAVNTTGITPANSYIPQPVWAGELADAMQAETSLAGLVDRKYEAQLKFGRQIEIPNMSNPAVRWKSEDTSATWANITETNQTLSVTLHGYVAFLVEDVAEIQSKYDIRSGYTSKAAYSLAATVDGDATNGLVSLADNFTGQYGTLGDDPTDDTILAAKNGLDINDVEMGGRFIWCSTGFYNALLKIDKFTRSNYVGDAAASAAVRNAKVGDIYNMPVHMSTLAYANPSGGATAGQAYAWMAQKEGVFLIMQRQPTIHTQYVILETAWGVLVDMLYNFATKTFVPKTLGGTTAADLKTVAMKGP